MMRRHHAETRQALAAEYVLGTLRGPARRRFERWLAADRDLRRCVVQWQRLLAETAEQCPPTQPPPRVWQGIESRLAGREQPAFSPKWRRISAAAATLVLGLAGLWALAPAPGERHKVVVTGPQDRVLWQITARGESLRVRTVNRPGMAPERQCRLWLRWRGRGVYRSVGVLAEEPGEHRQPLPEALPERLRESRVLVTVTPRGTPAGERPSGRVIFRGAWARL